MAPKDEPKTGDKKTKNKPEPKADVIEATAEPAKSEPKAEPKEEPGKPREKMQQRIYTRDVPPEPRITVEKFCAGLKVGSDQVAGFLRECQLKYGEHPKNLATVKEWAERHDAFKQRPIK